MVKGSRVASVRKVQPVKIHAQVSLDVCFSDADDPDGPVSVARVGGESVPRDLEPGDRIELHYLMGVVTDVRRAS